MHSTSHNLHLSHARTPVLPVSSVPNTPVHSVGYFASFPTPCRTENNHAGGLIEHPYDPDDDLFPLENEHTDDASRGDELNVGSISRTVFLRFVRKVRRGKGVELDVSGMLSRKCYETWVRTRRNNLQHPEESFRRAITAHVIASDGRKAFPRKVEALLLATIRKARVWDCFKPDPRDCTSNKNIRIGFQGFRSFGYHEKKGYKLPPSYIKMLELTEASGAASTTNGTTACKFEASSNVHNQSPKPSKRKAQSRTFPVGTHHHVQTSPGQLDMRPIFNKKKQKVANGEPASLVRKLSFKSPTASAGKLSFLEGAADFPPLRSMNLDKPHELNRQTLFSQNETVNVKTEEGFNCFMNAFDDNAGHVQMQEDLSAQLAGFGNRLEDPFIVENPDLLLFEG